MLLHTVSDERTVFGDSVMDIYDDVHSNKDNEAAFKVRHTPFPYTGFGQI